MEVFYPVDLAVASDSYQPRLPLCEIQELNSQMNCNLYCSEENELWFDQEDTLEMVSQIEESWFFEYV